MMTQIETKLLSLSEEFLVSFIVRIRVHRIYRCCQSSEWSAHVCAVWMARLLELEKDKNHDSSFLHPGFLGAFILSKYSRLR